MPVLFCLIDNDEQLLAEQEPWNSYLVMRRVQLRSGWRARSQTSGPAQAQARLPEIPCLAGKDLTMLLDLMGLISLMITVERESSRR